MMIKYIFRASSVCPTISLLMFGQCRYLKMPRGDQTHLEIGVDIMSAKIEQIDSYSYESLIVVDCVGNWQIYRPNTVW